MTYKQKHHILGNESCFLDPMLVFHTHPPRRCGFLACSPRSMSGSRGHWDGESVYMISMARGT